MGEMGEGLSVGQNTQNDYHMPVFLSSSGAFSHL